ncbi:MAG: hypothetical protein VSS75_032870 [Candidatus Parabeggiatoa sp.]|nr:hypothetical protein [Candidatus Parabeggiatoa sp.]
MLRVSASRLSFKETQGIAFCFRGDARQSKSTGNNPLSFFTQKFLRAKTFA